MRARAKSSTPISTTLPDEANLYCTGFDFTNNTFQYNYGCSQRAGGVIKFECVNFADASSYANDRIDATTNEFSPSIPSSICTMNKAYTVVSSLSNTNTIDMNKVNFY